jgi:hypothetical protein
VLRSISGVLAYRDKKVVGVFVRFRAPLHYCHYSCTVYCLEK